MPPLTIDNLGPEASRLYAENEKTRQEDAAQIKDSNAVPNKTEVIVTSPTPTDADNLVGATPKRQGWAIFRAPPDFFTQKKDQRRVFTDELIPSIHLEGKKEKLSAFLERRIAKRESPLEGSNKKQHYEQSRATEKDQREKKILDTAIDKIEDFNKMFKQAYNGRAQFHRG